jgi:hypothetical protein
MQITTSRTLRLAAGAALAVVACAAVLPAGAATKKKPGPNLVVNPGFEDSAFEGNGVVAKGSLQQPVLPTGWAFEGATVLFDHTPNAYHSGKRAAAISGTLSGGRNRCPVVGTCVDNPANAVKDATASTFSVVPAWRTQNAVPVKAGVTYRLSAWVAWDLMTQGTFASTRVRWLDAAGKVISETTATKVVADARNSALLRWKLVTGVAKAPAGAVGAHLLLSHADDAWTSQVRFDDVYFGTAA